MASPVRIMNERPLSISARDEENPPEVGDDLSPRGRPAAGEDDSSSSDSSSRHHHQLSIWQTILFGQLCALLVSGTNVTGGELAARKFDKPTFQSSLNYVLLLVVYGTASLVRFFSSRAKRKQEIMTSCSMRADSAAGAGTASRREINILRDHHDTGDLTMPLVQKSSSGLVQPLARPGTTTADADGILSAASRKESNDAGTPASHFSSRSRRATAPPCTQRVISVLRRVAFAACDVEANYLAVSAFQYTSGISISLILSSTAPWVMLFGFLTKMKTKYTLWQFLAVFVCLGGLGLTVYADYMRQEWLKTSEENEGEEDGADNGAAGACPSADPVRGDLYVVAAAILYAASNLQQEWFLQHQEGKVGEHQSQSVEDCSISSYPGINRNLDNSSATNGDHEVDARRRSRTNAQIKSTATTASASPSRISKAHAAQHAVTTEDEELSDGDEETSVWLSKQLSLPRSGGSGEHQPAQPNDPPQSSHHAEHHQTTELYRTLWLLGAFGTVISIIQFFSLEFTTNALDNSWQPLRESYEVVLLVLAFQLCLFSMYTCCALFLQYCDAVIFNLSLLTSDVYLLIYYTIRGEKVPWLFAIGFVLTVAGVILYTVTEPAEEGVEEVGGGGGEGHSNCCKRKERTASWSQNVEDPRLVSDLERKALEDSRTNRMNPRGTRDVVFFSPEQEARLYEEDQDLYADSARDFAGKKLSKRAQRLRATAAASEDHSRGGAGGAVSAPGSSGYFGKQDEGGSKSASTSRTAPSSSIALIKGPELL
ncbi:unnamed protein product [Amoebophrya sp. A120]|nr:unnamed protein product [Amoebophrya sp. A120]|eukprot:GSA120T00018250001.1